MANIYLYKARDAPIIVMLCYIEAERGWKLIRWNLDTDTFEEGETLTDVYMMTPEAGAVSPDGKYFAYWYSDIKNGKYDMGITHAVISEVPSFKPIFFYANTFSRMLDGMGFSRTGQPMITSEHKLEKCGETDLVQVPWDRTVINGTMSADKQYPFIDTRGRRIFARGKKLIVNGTAIRTV